MPSKYGKLIGSNGGSKDNRRWDFDPEALGTLARSVLRAGDALLIGCTRDGSAVRVILFDGDDKHSEYFGDDASLEEWCKSTGALIEKMLS